jgi:uncharacterized membrane protein YphA (DoxX/SURF4 family)
MIHTLFNGVRWTDMVLILNRVSVGMFFMFSGHHKLFDAGRHGVFADELRSLHVPAVGINEWWVPLVEFSAGAAVVIVALGLLVIILIATVTLMAQPDLRTIISAMSRRLVAALRKLWFVEHAASSRPLRS